MRASEIFGQTLRDAPADAEIPSHKLLVRGAFLRRVAAGIHAWLPLGRRVLLKVEQIVREEMDAEGGVELLMPMMQPADLWERSGRWQNALGGELYQLSDPAGREWALAATAEEVITFLGSTELSSYKDLPSIPYQIQWKFRYAPRPRGGLLRGREFLMKDAYSFDADEQGLLDSYARMERAYRKIFERCGLKVVQLEAHPGAIGGTVNHEFTQPCPNGEDTFVACESCDYSANTEVATGRIEAAYDFGDPPASPDKVHTPGKVTVEEVSAFLGVDPRQLAKTLIFRTEEGQLVGAVVPGDRELNDYKLSKALGGVRIELITEEEFTKQGISKGFSGPVDLPGVRVVADHSLQGARNLVTGGNETDYHLTGVVAGRDFEPEAWADLVVAEGGDLCARCGGKLTIERGIEVGHIFQLGTKYSQSMDARYTDVDGGQKPFVMGCYGLGLSRAVAAIVEAHHDERGIRWPRSVAPYQVCVIVLSDDQKARAAAGELARSLEGSGVEIIVDDREGLSAGVKFADADLIGYPLQVVVGKTFLASGKLEVKVRATGDRSEVEPVPEAIVAALLSSP